MALGYVHGYVQVERMDGGRERERERKVHILILHCAQESHLAGMQSFWDICQEHMRQ